MTMFTIMPVTSWIKPSTIAPMRIVVVSLSGSSSGLVRMPSWTSWPNIFTIVGTAFPKKPPVTMPSRNVDTPQANSSSQKYLLPRLGFILPSAMSAASTITRP